MRNWSTVSVGVDSLKSAFVVKYRWNADAHLLVKLIGQIKNVLRLEKK